MTERGELPAVSVVLPTYNRARWIAHSIRSVLAQSYTDFELIVIDDGSSDSTKQVVESFDDARIRYLYQENRGISGARNAGIRRARGAYVAFVDSDDVWMPSLLAREVPVLDADRRVGLVYARAQAIDESGARRPQSLGVPARFPGRPFLSMLYGDYGCWITSLVRAACFERVGLFDETLVGRVDWDLSLRIARHYDIAFVDEVLACFRTHAGRTTARTSPIYRDVFESRVKVLDKAYAQADLPEEAMAVKPLAYRNAYIDTGLHWLNLGERRKALNAFRLAIRVSPTPWSTPARILYLAVLYRYLSKSTMGMRLARGLVSLYRAVRWRDVPG